MSNPKTILIIDDVPKNIQMAMNILKDEGYKMLFGQSGKNALHSLENNKVDLILLDIMMPEMNGFEVCRILKQNENYKDIPVIFLSGNDQTEDIQEAYECGGIDYILKPFLNIELITKALTYTRLSGIKF